MVNKVDVKENSSGGTGNIVTTDFSPLKKEMGKLSFVETTHIYLNLNVPSLRLSWCLFFVLFDRTKVRPYNNGRAYGSKNLEKQKSLTSILNDEFKH
jgi:hypothetical protein